MNTTEPNSVPRDHKSLVGACELSLDSTTNIKFTKLMKMGTRWSGGKKWVSNEEKKTAEVVDDSWRIFPLEKFNLFILMVQRCIHKKN